MADKKISQLTALTGANTAADDLLAIVDTNAAETKKITREEFFKNIQTNVGIGVVPSAWSLGRALEIGFLGNGVFSPSQGTTNLINNTYYSSSAYRYATTAPAAYYAVNTGEHQWYTAPSGTAGNAITFTEAMRITSSGNVLVGTTANAFSSKMVVGGNLQIKPATNNSLEVLNPNIGTGIRLFARNDAGTQNRLELQGGQIIFPLTSGADGLYFDSSSGNLGLGVVPSAWNSLIKSLEIAQVGNGISSQAGSQTTVQNNAYFSSSSWTYSISSKEASAYQQVNGQHRFLTAPSGTAGNAITFTQAMTLDASGRLGIGTTSPASKLHLNNASGDTFIQIVQASTDSWTIGLPSGSAALTFGNSGTERMRISGTGIVTMSAYGAGTATFSAAGVISSVSDETWKTKDGVPVDPDAMLKMLEPGYWYYNDEKAPAFGSDRQLGFYAQNVNAAIGPEAAPTPEEGKPWGYYDRSVLAVAVMSLKNALSTIEELKERIATLENK